MNELTLQNNEVASFEALKKETIAIATACDKLTVTDDVSLAVATQNLSKANEYIKNIEKLRKELKDPYFQAGKKIDALADALSSPLEKTLASGKSKILTYNQDKEAKARAEQSRIQEIKDKIVLYNKGAILDMSLAKTDEALVVAHNKWIKNFPVDSFWSEFAGEAATMRANLLDYAKARRIEINKPAEADEETVVTIKEAITEQVQEVGSQQIEEAKFTTTTQFRGTWKEEVLHLSQLPLEWLMPDEKKIKIFSKENRHKLTDGVVIHGVKFYIDKTVQIR